MEKFDSMYDSLSGVYSEIESIMSSIYDELKVDPTNVDKANFLQGLGSVALKVISSQQQLVESYGSNEYKETLISNLDAKASALSDALAKDRNKTR